MLVSLTNFTPFAARAFAHVDTEGMQRALVVVKAVFNLNSNRLCSNRSALPLRDRPLTLRLNDLELDPMQRRALSAQLDDELDWLPTDNSPPKPRFDFLVCGYAHAPSEHLNGSTEFESAVVRRHQTIGLRATAPRRWRRARSAEGGADASAHDGPVRKVPLHPVFSFGGPSLGPQPLFNPQGMGMPRRGQTLEATPLPWLEHPSHRVTTPGHPPQPSAFGPWPENAAHRIRYVGTWDQHWQQHTSPRPPDDHSMRFYNLADERLQWELPPAAGETIGLRNLTPYGSAQLTWPHLRPRLQAVQQGTELPLMADTCIVDTEAQVYAVVWRAVSALGASLSLTVE